MTVYPSECPLFRVTTGGPFIMTGDIVEAVELDDAEGRSLGRSVVGVYVVDGRGFITRVEPTLVVALSVYDMEALTDAASDFARTAKERA